MPVDDEFHENVLYGLYGESDHRYYVVGNNVATLCDRKGGYVYMTSEYTKWINLSGDCNVTTGSLEITPALCDDPESAVFVFVTEDSAGRIIDWTRPYSPCTHVREIVVNGKMKAIDGFIVEFTKKWTYNQGLWTNVSNGISGAAGQEDCDFRVCVNGAGATLPDYIVRDLYCIRRRYGRTVIGMYNFPYYGMVNGLSLKCLVVVDRKSVV